jgi:hypothetical protein
MAVRSFTETRDTTFGNDVHFTTWSGLLNGDSGSPYSMPGFADRAIQIQGVFGVGGSCTIEGSLNGTNYIVLTDPQGNAITKTSASIEQISEVIRFIRPNVTAGDGTTNLTVSLIARKP